MSDEQLIIELPPPGTLIRDLALTAINMIGAFGEASISLRGNEVIVSHGDMTTALGRFSNEVYLIYGVKSKGRNFRWPYLHVNDKGTLKKIIPQSQLDKIETYGDVAVYFVREIPRILGQGGRLSVKIGRNSIQLGQGKLSMFQLFKVELYEKGLSYNMPYQLDLDVRMDEAWTSLLLAGFAVSYMGMRASDGVVLSTIPEIYDRCSQDSWLAINVASALYNVPTSPAIPYILYIYTTAILLEDPSDRKNMFSEVPEGLALFERLFADECKNRWIRGVGLRIHRIALAGRTFTEVSREDLTIGGEIARLANLCDKSGCACLQQVREIIRRGLGAEEPKILNALTMLYEALIGSKDPSEASYYIARAIRDQEEREGRQLISPYCFRRLVEVLTGFAMQS
ncbi:MAG: hypothetical protein QXE01_11655 [Sulfolobales archaeon]